MGKVRKEDKMASKRKKSIANELLDEISCAKFTQVLCLLNEEFALTIEQFKCIRDIAQSMYWVDTQKCISKSGRPIASGIFNIYGKFVSRLASEVCDEMIEWALDNKEELQNVVGIALRQLDISLMYWINRMQKESTPADEIACIA